MKQINLQHVEDSVRYIRQHVPLPPDIALVLGSGLGDYADALPVERLFSTSEIPSYPVSTVEGHKGKLVFATVGGKRLLVFQGRVHFYEVNDLAKVLHPIMIAATLGVKTLVITNAAGGVNRQLVPGDLMLISDQIDLTNEYCQIPLQKNQHKSLYDKELLARAIQIASVRNIQIKQGVYAGLKGPSYETAAEVEMIHRLGGDAVGMSTVKEVLLAAHLGMRVLGISCITNKGTGIGSTPLNHAEVTDVATRVRQQFTMLLDGLIAAF